MNASLAAKGFIVDGDKLLIIKRKDDNVQRPGIWEIPGGRIAPGEDPFLGLKREVMEETGIEIGVFDPLQVKYFTRADGQIITLIIFWCRALTRQVVLGDEHSAYEWIDIDKCKNKLSEFFHDCVDSYINITT